MLRPPAAPTRQRGFFDFSFPELVITFGVALVVLGPKKLPGLVQQVGRWVGRARHMARQFREQLEQEVNSINAVKPIPRNVAPEVGPAAPGATPAADAPTGTAGEAGVAANTAAAPVDAGAATPASVEVAGNDMHPEAQIYFAMEGSEPAVVARDPYELPVGTDDPQATLEQSAQTVGGESGQEHEAAPGAAPAPAAKVTEPSQPASVEVIFPHDHG